MPSSAITPSTLPVDSTKSMHGHTLGAAGAIERQRSRRCWRWARACCLRRQFHRAPGPRNVALDVIPNQARIANVEAALSQSFAFGGLNAVLAFRAWP